jgi:hypothetical protein
MSLVFVSGLIGRPPADEDDPVNEWTKGHGIGDREDRRGIDEDVLK